MSVAADEMVLMPVSDVVVDQAVVLDWQDGPRSGFLTFKHSEAAWYFRLCAELVSEDERDEGLYELSFVGSGVMPAVIDRLAELGEPTGPVWVPIWKFQTEESQHAAESALDELYSRSVPPELIIRSAADFSGVKDIWRAVS